MKKVCCIILCSLLAIGIAKAQEYVVISEIMYDTPLNEERGASPYTPLSNGEYIELFNLSDHSVDLSGWKLVSKIKPNAIGGGFVFPQNTIINSESTLVIAFQYKATTQVQILFDFYDLYPYRIFPIRSNALVYQHNLMLDNAGTFVVLKNKQGVTTDSIYYDGISNEGKINRLSAQNEDGTAGENCLSLHRWVVEFDKHGVAKTDNRDWITANVSPGKVYHDFLNPFIEMEESPRIEYSYDLAGNRVDKSIYIYIPRTSTRKSNVSQDNTTENPKIYEDVISGNSIVIYPNPTQGHLIVEIPNMPVDLLGYIGIYNAAGKLISKDRIISNKTELNIESEPTGIYVMKISLNGKTSTWKIIKE